MGGGFQNVLREVCVFILFATSLIAITHAEAGDAQSKIDAIIDYLLNGEPEPPSDCDVNFDGVIDIADAVKTIFLDVGLATQIQLVAESEFAPQNTSTLFFIDLLDADGRIVNPGTQGSEQGPVDVMVSVNGNGTINGGPEKTAMVTIDSPVGGHFFVDSNAPNQIYTVTAMVIEPTLGTNTFANPSTTFRIDTEPSGSASGQVEIVVGGIAEPPAPNQVRIEVRKILGADRDPTFFARDIGIADAQGNWIIDGLPPGNYAARMTSRAPSANSRAFEVGETQFSVEQDQETQTGIFQIDEIIESASLLLLATRADGTTPVDGGVASVRYVEPVPEGLSRKVPIKVPITGGSATLLDLPPGQVFINARLVEVATGRILEQTLMPSDVELVAGEQAVANLDLAQFCNLIVSPEAERMASDYFAHMTSPDSGGLFPDSIGVRLYDRFGRRQFRGEGPVLGNVPVVGRAFSRADDVDDSINPFARNYTALLVAELFNVETSLGCHFGTQEPEFVDVIDPPGTSGIKAPGGTPVIQNLPFPGPGNRYELNVSKPNPTIGDVVQIWVDVVDDQGEVQFNVNPGRPSIDSDLDYPYTATVNGSATFGFGSAQQVDDTISFANGDTQIVRNTVAECIDFTVTGDFGTEVKRLCFQEGNTVTGMVTIPDGGGGQMPPGPNTAFISLHINGLRDSNRSGFAASDGTFSIEDIPAGSIDVVSEIMGVDPEPLPLCNSFVFPGSGDSEVTMFDHALSSGAATISGVARDETGTPLDGGSCELFRTDQPLCQSEDVNLAHPIQSVPIANDGSGNFALDGVEDGEYIIQVARSSMGQFFTNGDGQIYIVTGGQDVTEDLTVPRSGLIRGVTPLNHQRNRGDSVIFAWDAMPATSTPSTDFLYELLIQNQFGSTQIKLSDIDAQVMEVDTSTLKPGTYQWRVRGHKPGAYETQRWVNDGRNFFEINC